MLTKTAMFKAAMAAATVLALATVAQAQDPGRGRALAQGRCATCHNVNGGPGGRGRSAPSFAEIAQRSNLSTSQLSITLAYSHTPMRDVRIGAGEAGDLAAYILSLRRR